ncbi:FadR/GntR family transcriptional regulator [Streptomyces iconiensis]|uniref:FadR/GntR family transcriptional regulator n=1 Tax=Streptomyces iconiensis TaxID=1384038 RepID=A0ABT6ZQW2_9ACTN|nr:FadR/GntR family transcriptional regulator [Streptomyces iconiensis]MDJ1131448.1 FadR/GntR family transcriptional regulator [Streptomyces iconiensis]
MASQAESPTRSSRQGEGLHARLLASLGPAITGGEHPPGTVLRTDELAEKHEVSRTVVREAVRVLESMHLVESRRRVGVTVLPAEEWNVYDPQVITWRLAGADRPRQLRSLTVLRSAVEPVAARLAAGLATPEQCAEVTGQALGMVATSRGGQLEKYLVHDVAFHRAILRASGNEMFARLGDVVAAVLTGRTEHEVMFSDPRQEAVTLHVQVAEAIRERDAERAEAAMRTITLDAMAELDVLVP